MQQLTCVHDLRLAPDAELETSFQALNGDLACDLVRWDVPSGWQDEAHDLELSGLEQRKALCRCGLVSKQIDYLA